MKLVILATICFFALAVNGCVTPVTAKHWATCEELCQDKGGVLEACVEVFAGPACHCTDDTVTWIKEDQT